MNMLRWLFQNLFLGFEVQNDNCYLRNDLLHSILYFLLLHNWSKTEHPKIQDYMLLLPVMNSINSRLNDNALQLNNQIVKLDCVQSEFQLPTTKPLQNPSIFRVFCILYPKQNSICRRIVNQIHLQKSERISQVQN